MTILVEKLEREYKELYRLSDYYPELDDVAIGFLRAIKIVKQHSDWVPVRELKLTEDDYGKDFIAYECEYFKTTGRATYQDGGYWRFDCARGYCASANISHVIPIPKFQPPSEVQDV